MLDKAGKLSAADEIDRVGAARADFGGERLLTRSPDDDGQGAGRLDQAEKTLKRLSRKDGAK